MQALPPDGKLVALERDEKALRVARRYWEKAGVTHKVSDRSLPFRSRKVVRIERGHVP